MSEEKRPFHSSPRQDESMKVGSIQTQLDGSSSWDAALRNFFHSSGLKETLRAFETDILTLNSTYEREIVAEALVTLVGALTKTQRDGKDSDKPDIELRKLNYLQDSAHPVSPTTWTKSISEFLASSRARSNRSNTEEFLRPMKRRRIGTLPSTPPSQHIPSNSDSPNPEPMPTCARTDTIRVNRDIQMKYDIVKNDEGPLGKTMHGTFNDSTEVFRRAPGQGMGGAIGSSKGKDVPTLDRHPGLTERFKNIEDHLAIRYIPRPPEDIRLRLKTIEDHIIRLEGDYPPWAALHFNQPRRDWPPPPPSNPIVIPTHLTIPDPTISTSIPQASSSTFISIPHSSGSSTPPPLPAAAPASTSSTSGSVKGKARIRSSRTESSLYRAVMEKLEVSKALSEGARVADLDGGVIQLHHSADQFWEVVEKE